MRALLYTSRFYVGQWRIVIVWDVIRWATRYWKNRRWLPRPFKWGRIYDPTIGEFFPGMWFGPIEITKRSHDE